MDDSQGNHRYDMIIWFDILSELKIDFSLSENKIRVNGVMYEGCTSPEKEISKINFNTPYN